MNYPCFLVSSCGLMLAVSAFSPMAQSRTSPLDPELKKALLEEISPELKPQGIKPEEQRVFADYIDLNGDGQREAIVVLIGSFWCGSGGCTMKVFAGHDRHFHLVSTSSLIRTPITVSEQKTNGWRDLIVEVSGGGMAAKKVALKFDGKKYPLNPSTLSPLTANTRITGKMLFPRGSQPQPIQ